MPTIDAAWRLAADVMKVATEEDLVDILREVCTRMGCSWFALSHHIDFLAAPEKGIRVHNYPEDWAHWFDQERLGVSDPVHRASERRMAGVLWRDVAEFNSSMSAKTRCASTSVLLAPSTTRRAAPTSSFALCSTARSASATSLATDTPLLWLGARALCRSIGLSLFFQETVQC